MKLDFENISLEEQGRYRERFGRCPVKMSDCSFVNLYGWKQAYGLQWAWQDDLVWIRQTVPAIFYWAPVGDWHRIDWKTRITSLLEHETEFVRIPALLADLWKTVLSDQMDRQTDRGDWDYVYRVKDLVDLAGNRYHKKKNLLNQFVKTYDYQYVPLKAGTIQQALDMQDQWCEWRDCESVETLSAENQAIDRVLRVWDQLDGVFGAALVVDAEMVAYTVAEALNQDTLVIHFEKGANGYRGVYQAINQMFLQSIQSQYEFVNREQDLNDDGLRKAKLSYHPDHFIEKYRVTFASGQSSESTS